ncbi:uncharacterized protein OCT59_007858 [Rhizophagus irregularis]|uniref:uncharacterized protein n=1 Tax=Rhizophagus irregularis TaxID=588596 RepID=UPI00332DA1EE|nr:hypothetical protein OCT59_007858 [Rhizophagus irregularis]
MIDILMSTFLKTAINDSSNINEDFLNEWKLHLQCQHEAFLNYAVLIPIIGITQDPDTLNYMIVMDYAFDSSLRDNLLMKKYNPNDKFKNLFDISKQLKAIHKLNLVHGDFHNGNILQKYPIEQDEKKRIPVPENEPEIKYHSKSCYTSRIFNCVAKLNEILLQDELSNKIIIMDDENDNHDGINKNFGNV